VQQLLNTLGAMQHFDHAHPVVRQRRLGCAAPSNALKIFLSASASGVGMKSPIVDPGKRADPVPALFPAPRPDEGEFM